MNVYSVDDKTITIEREVDINLGDLLCTRDIAIGVVRELNNDKIIISLLTNIFKIKLGANENFFFQKKNNYFFLEYVDNIITPNGSINGIKWESEFDFVGILEEKCQVSSGDVIGYIKYKNLKYPLLVPDEIHEGVLVSNSPNKVNYEKAVNQITFQGRQYPIFIYQNNIFNLNKLNVEEGSKIVLKNREFDQEVIKLISTFDVVLHLSSRLPSSYIQNSITNIKEYFNRANTNNTTVIGYSDYPSFNSEYTKIIVDKVVENIKQFILRGVSIILFVEEFNDDFLDELRILEGEYKTKSGISTFKIVELKDSL